MRSVRPLALPLSVLLFLLLFLPAQARAEVVDKDEEYKLKAAYTFNYTKFITWPEEVEKLTSFTLCVTGDKAFYAAFKPVEQKKFNGRSFRVIQKDKDFEECRLLFIGASKKNQGKQIAAKLRGHPILTVGDFPGFARAGGMIELLRKDERLRFEINHDVARSEGVMINSNLLELATKVYFKGKIYEGGIAGETYENSGR